MTQIQRIPFHDDTILAITDERTGKHYVLPKPMVEMFGLDWSGQLAKLKRNKLFAKGMEIISIPSTSGEQETTLLERRLIHPWLLSIDAGRIAEQFRAKLLRYQEECADVLDAYFTGQSAQPVLPVIHDPTMKMLIDMAYKHDAALHEIACIKMEQERQDKALIAQQARLIEALQTSQRADTKADMALDEARRMTLEEFILANGLLRQFPESQHATYSRWLVRFCKDHGLHVPKAPVLQKPWKVENAYPLQALAAWLRYEQCKPTQIALVSKRAAEEVG